MEHKSDHKKSIIYEIYEEHTFPYRTQKVLEESTSLKNKSTSVYAIIMASMFLSGIVALAILIIFCITLLHPISLFFFLLIYNLSCKL